MNKTVQNVLIGLALVIGLVGIFTGGSSITKIVKTGSIASPEVNGYMRVHGFFTQGGGVNATSTTATSQPLVAADISNYNVLDVTPNTGNLTLTLPATTSFPTIDTAGSYRTWVVRNATTSAITITMAAGTGIDLQEPDGQNVVIGQNNLAWLTCYRKADTDIVCRVDETIPAD